MSTTFKQWHESSDGGPVATCEDYWNAGAQSAECDLTQFKEFSKLAARAMNDADAVLATVDCETAEEAEKIIAISRALSELVYQAFCLNGVMSLKQLGGA